MAHLRTAHDVEDQSSDTVTWSSKASKNSAFLLTTGKILTGERSRKGAKTIKRILEAGQLLSLLKSWCRKGAAEGSYFAGHGQEGTDWKVPDIAVTFCGGL